MRVLAISGSLRDGSHNTALLRALREEAPAGIEIELWDGLKEIPPYDADDDVVPGPGDGRGVPRARPRGRTPSSSRHPSTTRRSRARSRMRSTGPRGPLATNAFRNKPVAVISSSAGAFGGVWAAAELRKVLGAMGARVTEAELSVGHAHEKFDDDGRLVDDDVRQGLRDALETLVAEVPAAIAA